MTSINRWTVSALLFAIMGFSSLAHAALIDTDPSDGMVYDDDLNITWLADANFAKTSGADADGRMTWADANAWAASLRVGGVADWRLPTTLQSDASCTGGRFNCTGSEMGHLFYNELGGTAGSSILSSSDPDLALFSNVQSDFYWSGTEFAPNPSNAWFFLFDLGNQFAFSKDSTVFAWAVHSGNVSGTVPEPATVWLFGSGLIGLLGLVRRKR